MNEDRQARLLAEWLDGSADQTAPEGIDVDVLEAIYVLQPDRAPAPRVTLQDILAPRAATTRVAPEPPPRSATPIRARSSSRFGGFARKSSAPASSASTTAPESSLPVRTMAPMLGSASNLFHRTS